MSMQEKVEIYLLGLAFTLLGLSIQTATFTGPPPQRIAELIGWTLLLASGVIAIRRLQWVPVYLHYGAVRQGFEREVARAPNELDAEIQFDDGVLTVREYIASRQKAAADIEIKENPIHDKIILMGQIQLWSFVTGLVAVAVSRAYVPVQGLIALVSG